jgi:hypothetical protein
VITGPLGREFADVILVLGKQTFLAHWAFLAARSSYFRAMFRSGLQFFETTGFTYHFFTHTQACAST